MRAKILAVAVSVICPKCNEPIGAPDNGSDMWETNQIFPRIVDCLCGARVEIVVPKSAKLA